MTDLPATDEELRALVEKATPLPWFYRPREDKHGGAWIADHPEKGKHSKIIVVAGACYSGSDDYELIAKGLSALPDLLKRLSQAEGERDALLERPKEWWVARIAGEADVPIGAGVSDDWQSRAIKAEAEVARLNKWADGFSDAQLKERRTGEDFQRELQALAQSHKERGDRLVGALVTVKIATDVRSSERLRKLNDFVSAALQDDGGAK